MRLYYPTTTDPALNLACEELLARNSEDSVFMLWRNAPSIIVGCNQNTAAEIDDDFVQRRQIQVVRRITGGGAVYHDLGNINYSCITSGRTWGPGSAAEFTVPIINALQALGLQAEFAGRNDILANGCKVSGCARSLLGNHTLFHGTLLFDTDLEVLSQALRPDPEKIRSKGIKSVRARVGNLREMLPSNQAGMTMEAFIEHLLRSTCRFYQKKQPDPFPEKLRLAAETLAETKYRTWNWNYGTTMEYQVRKKCRFAGGIIQAEFNVRDNRLTDLRLSGDFFGTQPVAGLVANLIGLPPQQNAILAHLQNIPYQEYISGITAQELASLLAV